MLQKLAYVLVMLVGFSLFQLGCSKYYKGPDSDHFDGRIFFDPDSPNTNTLFTFLKWQRTAQPSPWPTAKTLKHTDLPPQRIEGQTLRVSNVGHATLLIQTEGLNILTDPVWSDRAGPFAAFGPKRVYPPGIVFEELPPIDIIWVSHNHYDHLDLSTLKKLWLRDKPRIITPLGNDSIIKSIGKGIKVEAHDWGDTINIKKGIDLHLTPMQHWSARGILDRNKALWAALTITTPHGNIYFVGDSGYGDGRYFKKDLNRFGHFRLAILPIGAYKPRWFMKYAHMNPDDFVLAHKDLGAPPTIPTHYDVFRLADEGFGDALDDLKAAIIKYKTGSNIKVIPFGQAWEVP